MNQSVPTARRDLKPNHRLFESDIQPLDKDQLHVGTITSPAELLKKYLLVPKTKGETFQIEDVAGTPSLSYSAKPLVSVVVASSRALNGYLEPGTVLDLYGLPKGVNNPALLPKEATVEAVLDVAATAEPNCILVLALGLDSHETGAPAVLVGVSELIVMVRG